MNLITLIGLVSSILGIASFLVLENKKKFRATVFFGLIALAFFAGSYYRNHTEKQKESEKMKLIFVDEFDNNKYRWPEENKDNSSRVARIDNGRYVIESFNYDSSLSRGKSLKINTKRNFIIETKIAVLRNNKTGYGLFWGGNGKSTHHYWFVEDNSYHIGSSHDEHTNISTKELPKNILKQGIYSNKLRIEKIGTELIFTINDKKIGVTSFESFYGNGIGIFLNGEGKVSIDYFKIWN